MDRLQSPIPTLAFFPQGISGEKPVPQPEVRDGLTLNQINGFLQPTQTRLHDRQMATCQVLDFDPPDVYEEKARGNMKAFLVINNKEFSKCPFESPTSAWLSSEQIQFLGKSDKGRALLMLVNDADLLATECVGKKCIHTVGEFVRHEKLPFEFSFDANTLLNEIRAYFAALIYNVIGSRRDYYIRDMQTLNDLNLTGIETVNYERLLAKIVLFVARDIKRVNLSRESLLVDFLRTVELNTESESCSLLNLTEEAFAVWLDMQLAFYKMIVSNFWLFDTKVITGASRLLWSFCNDGAASPECVFNNQEKILDYMAFFLIPDQVLPVLFSKPITDTVKCVLSPTANEVLLSRVKTSSPPGAFPRNMNTDLLTTGEEFEYLRPNGTEFTTNEIDATLKQWHSKLEEILKNSNISDFYIKPDCYTGSHLIGSLGVRISNWHYTAHMDAGVLEVNTSPYHLNQFYKINGESVSVYHCFDVFIFAIARSLRLPTCSGHKHIGLDKALYGNGEIILRLLLDVERRAWFPRLFLREQKAEDYFCYIRNHPRKEPHIFVLNAFVMAFNKQLQISPERKINESFCSIKELSTALTMRGVWSDKYVPLNLLHLSANVAEQESERVRKARTTIEFRFPQAPRSGEEAKRINELFTAWLQLMEQHQHDNKPLQLELGDPMDYAENKDDEVERLFCDFVKELGLDWDTFKHLSFLPHEKLSL